MSKLDCFIRFNEVNYWLSRTRDLIATAETYTYPAFKESFRELRRKSRKASSSWCLRFSNSKEKWRPKQISVLSETGEGKVSEEWWERL